MRSSQHIALVALLAGFAAVAVPVHAQTGAGVRVYILDSGIRATHEQFGGRVATGPNFADGPNADCVGHGTHVAGIVGGRTTGIAPDVTMISVRVLNCSLSGTVAGVVQGIQWVTQHYRTYGGPAVALISLTTAPVPWSFEDIDAAIHESTGTGLTWVAIAGNYGSWVFDYSPARESSVITVGAMDRNHWRPEWSNYGPQVTVHTLGVDIVSAYHTADNAYAMASGTSMAAPRIAGYAARLLQMYPWAPAAHVKNLLTSQSQPLMANTPPGTPNNVVP